MLILFPGVSLTTPGRDLPVARQPSGKAQNRTAPGPADQASRWIKGFPIAAAQLYGYADQPTDEEKLPDYKVHAPRPVGLDAVLRTAAWRRSTATLFRSSCHQQPAVKHALSRIRNRPGKPRKLPERSDHSPTPACVYSPPPAAAFSSPTSLEAIANRCVLLAIYRTLLATMGVL